MLCVPSKLIAVEIVLSAWEPFSQSIYSSYQSLDAHTHILLDALHL